MKLSVWATASLLAGSLFVALYANAAIKNGLLTKDKQKFESVQICLPSREATLTPRLRAHIAKALGWQKAPATLCQGYYLEPVLEPTDNSKQETTQISADKVSLYNAGRSKLSGDVWVRQTSREISASTAYITRDPKTQKVTKIELLGRVRYNEQGRLMVADKIIINADDKSADIYDAIYRISPDYQAVAQGSMMRLQGLNGWGRASKIQRLNNGDSKLDNATYSTCPPLKNEWQIQAKRIDIDKDKGVAVARDATLLIKDWPVLYAPYLSFPTNKQRKSGFLMPVVGYSNQAGFDMATPYYWNMAPNHDLVLTPHVYTKRGVMLGGGFRYLSTNSSGTLGGDFLPDDKAYGRFLQSNQEAFPQLRGDSTNRWAMRWLNTSQLTPNWHFDVDFQQVSDDFYLQDFSSNLAWTTENQLLRQAYTTYSDSHWLIRGGVQSYQTLHPFNQTATLDAYQRLPQLLASGRYLLPGNLVVGLNAEYDYFLWPVGNQMTIPQGSRYHFSPLISLPMRKPWGYMTPTLQWQLNQYDLGHYNNSSMNFTRSIPQISVDGGLFFDREFNWFGEHFLQTLEPRLYYLYVPFAAQQQIPVFDAGTYIFNYAQLFRPNRFSGIDRIGDANQLTYAMTTRFLNEEGQEKAHLSVGQIAYFRDRLVQLCFDSTKPCLDSAAIQLDYSSPTAKYSPVAGTLTYYLFTPWSVTANLAWDPDARRTTNGEMHLNYLGGVNRLFSVGYTYMVNGDTTQVARSMRQNNALNQVNMSYAWPINSNWSSLGAYGYNLSKRYNMTYLLGLQYDDCCWAVRLIGGKTYRDLNAQLEPNYTTNVYLQILLKGLGSVGNTSPSSVISTYIPGYKDLFQ